MDYTFRHRRTGNVIIVSCPLEGPDWEEVTEAKTEPEEKAPKAAPKKRAARKGADT